MIKCLNDRYLITNDIHIITNDTGAVRDQTIFVNFDRLLLVLGEQTPNNDDEYLELSTMDFDHLEFHSCPPCISKM